MTFFFLNESTLDFLHNPSTLSPFQLADSSDPSWFCSHAFSSRSFLGLHRLHTPSATSHILSQASVRHFLPCIRYVWYVLPGLLLLGVPLKLGPSLIHPSAPPPPPLRAQHSAGAQEGFAAVSCTFAMPHHQHFEHHPCLFNTSPSFFYDPPKECDTGISKKEERPPVNSSEW